MIVVRFVLQAKSVKAEDVVKNFQKNVEMMRRLTGTEGKVRLLTDLSGPFDTVVQEIELESLAEWERVRANIFSDSEFQATQSDGESPVVSGRTEFYTLEAVI